MLASLLAILGIGFIMMANGCLTGAEGVVRATRRAGMGSWCTQRNGQGRFLAWARRDPERLCGAVRLVRALGAILAGALGGFAAVEGVVLTLLTTLRPDVPTSRRQASGWRWASW